VRLDVFLPNTELFCDDLAENVPCFTRAEPGGRNGGVFPAPDHGVDKILDRVAGLGRFRTQRGIAATKRKIRERRCSVQ
jgi:hypothetical protein